MGASVCLGHATDWWAAGLLVFNLIYVSFYCLQIARRTSGVAVTGCVCPRMLCVTKRGTAKTGATRPIVKPVKCQNVVIFRCAWLLFLPVVVKLAVFGFAC